MTIPKMMRTHTHTWIVGESKCPLTDDYIDLMMMIPQQIKQTNFRYYYAYEIAIPLNLLYGFYCLFVYTLNG